MSGKCSVTVLAPNGRRQTVRTSENTTILQILEEVCKKQGFNPNDYDLKHINRILDTNATIRFSGIPNNAQLEMTKAQKVRKESEVTLVVQLESGSRVTGTFHPTDTLWQVLMNVCPTEVDSNLNPVAIYMRNEIVGEEALTVTSLRSLGLTGGRALIRLIHRSVEQLGTQANVSAPLKRTAQENKDSDSEQQPEVSRPIAFVTPVHVSPELEQSSHQPYEVQDVTMNSVNRETQAVSVNTLESVSDNVVTNSAQVQDVEMYDEQETVNRTVVNSNNEISNLIEDDPVSTSNITSNDVSKLLEDITYLGERNALVFSMASVEKVSHEDLPDEFFDLTTQEIRKLQKELQQKREELENRNLKTTTLREAEENRRMSAMLERYQNVVIRIQFPDQTVLQGIFEPFETISSVEDFVRTYLENSSMPFYLFTAPPRTIWPSNTKLVDAKCFPNALLYFGRENTGSCKTYLKSDVLSRLASPSLASLSASMSRKFTMDHSSSTNVMPPNVMQTNENQTSTSQATTKETSKSQVSGKVDRPSQKSSNVKQDTIPKWFKRP